MAFTPRQAALINADRPQQSVTGSPTVEVGPEALQMLEAELRRTGYIIHSSHGMTAWASARLCREANFPYQVLVVQDAIGMTMGVIVQRTDKGLEQINLPAGWKVAVTEIYPVYGE